MKLFLIKKKSLKKKKKRKKVKKELCTAQQIKLTVITPVGVEIWVCSHRRLRCYFTKWEAKGNW